MSTVLLGMLINPDPCSGVPDISSVDSSPTLSDNGNCSLFDGLKWDVDLTLTGTLPQGAKVQYRYDFSTSSNPDPANGTWADWSGFSGSSDTITIEPQSMTGSGFPGPYARTSGENSIGTGYFQAEFRVIGTDGTTVCDDTGGESGTSSTTDVWSCAA